MLKNREIILGVSGGIAAYKSVELLREMTKKGANVHVVMTKNAQQFVTPLTFQTLSGNPVLRDMFQLLEGSKIGHVALADIADLMVICPATANIMGKIANGIADDFLTTMVMTTKVPVLLSPSMNVNMWQSSFVQNNVERLKAHGYQFVDPIEGDLACGSIGKGKLADIEEIIEKIEDIFTKKDLFNQRILITAGPTLEPIDPVRYITNRSSGKMGFALAKMARRRGAEVTLITGPHSLSLPRRDIPQIMVSDAREMHEAVMHYFEDSHIVIMAAAVADFRPRDILTEKITKRKNGAYLLEMEKNPDILKELGEKKSNHILVGFAAETSELMENAEVKLKEKNLDLIVANDVTQPGAGFGVDTNIVKILDAAGKVKKVPLLSKDDVAHIILDQLVKLVKKKEKDLPWPRNW
ncbi:MAG: phosphopantothenoylcysteine decarboxylase [Deltaproteobacteria bacterium RBG_16_54_11]|jgi:phosphopantothenoylcysteine decarboxylase/phosphopantothenate--cysteine ligase|nr:MAG: phosphopantothenoylcysteine decarboxylase [Deltaproteobacteria bacterium RBG_16_54_11]